MKLIFIFPVLALGCLPLLAVAQEETNETQPGVVTEGGTAPAQAPVVEPAPPVISPASTPEPMPGKTRLRTVDPELRSLYLGEHGSRLGSPKGPQNLQTIKPGKEERVWHTELEVGATGYRGNSDADLMLLKLQIDREEEGSRLNLGARGNVGHRDGETDRKNAGANASYRHDLDERFYYSSELRYFYDAMASLDYQVMGMFSLGYDIAKSEAAIFSIETGPAYIVEKKGEEGKEFLALRCAESLEVKVNEQALIWERAEYLPALSDPGVYLFIAEAGVETALSSRLRFRTVYQYRYDSSPAEGKISSDAFIAASLVAVY